jgi:hypothetical protein
LPAATFRGDANERHHAHFRANASFRDQDHFVARRERVLAGLPANLIARLYYGKRPATGDATSRGALPSSISEIVITAPRMPSYAALFDGCAAIDPPAIATGRAAGLPVVGLGYSPRSPQ